MLTIREAQFKFFADGAQEKFEIWMLAHLQKFFPAQCPSGDARLREFLRYGIKRAASYRFTSRRDVCKYIDLMVAFGRDFDKDKRFPWAAEILGKPRDPEGKMSLLFHVALNHLQ